jgi:hypothetical protein
MSRSGQNRADAMCMTERAHLRACTGNAVETAILSPEDLEKNWTWHGARI